MISIRLFKLSALCIFFLLLWNINTFAEDNHNNIIEEQYNFSGLDKLNKTFEDLVHYDTREFLPDFKMEKVIKDISKGDIKFDFNSLFNRIIKLFVKEIYINIKIMLRLIVMIILCGVLTNLQGAFGDKGVSEIAFFGCYVFLCGILMKSFMLAIDMGRSVIDNMVMFMQVMLPVLITLLLSTGNIVSSSIFQPTVLLIVQTIGGVVKYFSIPMILFSMVIAIANNVSGKFQIKNMGEILKLVNKWVLGTLLTIFIGILSIQGFTTSVADGISAKTAKYAVGNMIPVFGGLLADAVDTVIGCSLILKNAVGIAGLITIVIIVVVPMIKIIALIFVYRLTAALAEPISDKRIVGCISECANTLSFMFVLVAIVAVMFILCIAIMIGAANISAMFR